MKERTMGLPGVIIIIVLCIAVACVLVVENMPTKPAEIQYIGSFDPADYKWGMKYGTSNKTVEPVTEAEAAGRAGEKLWAEELGDDENPGKRIEVYYNEQQGCWLIAGTKPNRAAQRGWTGVLPYAMIQENGTVIAVWRE